MQKLINWVPDILINRQAKKVNLCKNSKGLLFRVTKRRMQQIVEKYSDKSGIKATSHTLRHSHVVHALMDKMPIADVQRRIGHKKLETTAIYSDLAPEQVKETYLRRER